MRAIDVGGTKAPKRKPRAKSERKLGPTRAPLRKIKLPLIASARRPAIQLPVAGEGSMF